jgi:hypothetical protein
MPILTFLFPQFLATENLQKPVLFRIFDLKILFLAKTGHRVKKWLQSLLSLLLLLLLRAPELLSWSSSSLLSLSVSLKFGLFHLNLSLFFFLFVFSPCSHILTSCLLSLQIGFRVCMLAGCMWVGFSVWRTKRMPDASNHNTNKQTNKHCVVLSWEQD